RSTMFNHELPVGVKCRRNRLCRDSHRFTDGLLCVLELSTTRCKSKSPGVWWSIQRRNLMNSSERCRGMHSPITFPEILSILVAGKVSVSDRCSPFRGVSKYHPIPNRLL